MECSISWFWLLASTTRQELFSLLPIMQSQRAAVYTKCIVKRVWQSSGHGLSSKVKKVFDELLVWVWVFGMIYGVVFQKFVDSVKAFDQNISARIRGVLCNFSYRIGGMVEIARSERDWLIKRNMRLFAGYVTFEGADGLWAYALCGISLYYLKMAFWCDR